MSDPRRILDGPSATPFERDLLESWSAEQPSTAARARALAIAGAAAGTLAAATAATAAASSTGVGAAAGAAAPSATGISIAMLTKWGVLFAFVVASAVAGMVVLGRAHTDEAPPTAVATPAMAAAPITAAPATVEPKAVSPADLPAAAPTIPTPASTAMAAATGAATAAAASTAASVSFAEEIAAFDRARSALDAGESDRALALVDAYEKRFPAGTFVQEAEVLRVQALARKGDDAGARRVGQRFLAAHPTSPHAARIRAILDSSAP
ncbi:MAG: hypothetical protein QOI41_3200 [Myxococcales bacterium]|jgi:TolA-binding protein|nr:hypothetical protein [Myxococcales bacterium]